jgi:Zn-dependent peptidase ImmA (M78 family)
MSDKNKYKYADSLLGELFKKPTLKELFEAKLDELNMKPTTAQKVLDIGYKPLKRILESTETTINLINLFKLADFLQLPRERVVRLYTESLEKTVYKVSEVTSSEKVKFIKDNFDLAVLRKAGLIDSISDFDQAEKKITARLGLKSIFEYREPPIEIAFSSGNFNSKHHRTRSFWIQSAIPCFVEINNPYQYERDQLVNFFQQIRQYSTINNGLVQIVKILFKMGITTIFQPSLQNLKLRGATFVVNNKPCIVLTDYVGFYPTLWFALIHELYHVLFDLEDINTSRYHLSDDSNDTASVREREALADNFAREYLFSKDKLKAIRRNLRYHSLVCEFAEDNHVDPSIIYAFYAFDQGKNDRMAWARLRRYSPPVKPIVDAISFPWNGSVDIEKIIKSKKDVFN